jgi:23S rRNA (adenine2030-N6)-methyltransferase
MNYRHAFHAGNHADVLKHVVLSRILVLMTSKDRPLAFLDAHAGLGHYDLMGLAAGKTLEWQSGIAKLRAPFGPEVEALLAPYRQVVNGLNDGNAVLRYPGSPALAMHLLRAKDRLIFNELHPEDKVLLEAWSGSDRRVSVTGDDALVAIKSKLPFRENRGVVLIDPQFESEDETTRVVRLLEQGLRRMKTAVFAIWYPVTDAGFGRGFVAAVAALQVSNLLHVEIGVRQAMAGGGLAGSGVLIINAPWKLDTELNILVPALARRLGIGQWGRGHVTWLTPRI